MNIASASLEMQRDYGVAVSHCERVLVLEPDNAVCHFRMGQLLRASHKYDKALTHLDRAQQLCVRVVNAAPFADAIAKEMDKTQFDRSQYDYEFIRAAVSSEKQQAS
jgi:tetratricopeptide (TPR) repeat protein